MSFKYFLLTLFFILPLSVSALTEEERIERERVLNEYGTAEEKRKAQQADNPSLVDQTKETLSNSIDNLKEKLPDSVKNMMPGNSDTATKPDTIDQDMQAAQQGGEVLDPDAELKDADAASAPMKMPKIDPEELSKIMKNLDGNPLMKMLSPQQREAAAKMMKQNPFATMKKEAIKKIILTKMDSKKAAGKFLHDNPKLVDTIAEWVIDDKAIPAFISIINKPDKAKIMGGIVIAVFITVFFLNLKNSKNNMLKRIFFKLGLMIASAVVNFTSFYIIYREELGPTVDVISRTM